MIEFTFPILQGGVEFSPPSVGVDIGDDPAVAVAIASSRALVRPFARDGRGGFVTGDYVARVASTVGLIIGTRRGSFAADPGFGTLLWTLAQRPANDPTTDALARSYVVDALTRYEPRARLVALQTTDRYSDGTVLRIVAVSFNVLFKNAVLAREQTMEVNA